ncbi:MAG TPA: DUF4184 family protein [Fibrobacteria bacterium]|nr:DUF4184 family protein [Fibrobacteria bacterium]HOX52448.1 DUF4184 family protein [Fibrobacteria bacterium]
MPFTLSHPALVLPLLSRVRAGGWKVSLFLGAMAPDFWVLAPGILDRSSTHGRWGLLLCPPFALVASWLFHGWFFQRIRRLPGIVSSYPIGPFHWGWSAFGAILGTLTHLMWDQLTHEGSRLQVRHPVFDKVWFVVGNDAITIGQAAWIGSSLVGALILAIWIWGKIRRWGIPLATFVAWPWVVTSFCAVAPGVSYFGWRLFPLYLENGQPRYLLDPISDIRYLVVVSAALVAASIWMCTGDAKNAFREGRR